MTRAILSLLLLAAGLACAQQAQPQQQQQPVEPPEEDASLREKEYTLNPLQAEKEFKVGLFYMKKGSWRAAASRFDEAVKWNPTMANAYLKLAEASEKLGDKNRATEAYRQFLEAAPDHKRAAEVRKKIPAPPAAASAKPR